MDHRIAPDPGQPGVDLHNDPLGPLKKGALIDQAQGHAEIAVLIHGGHSGDKHVVPIDLNPAAHAAVQVVGIGGHHAVLVSLPRALHHEAAGVVEGLRIGGIIHKGVVSGCNRQIGVNIGGMSLQQGHMLADDVGAAASLGKGHGLSGLDGQHRLLHRDQFIFILSIEIHTCILPYCFCLYHTRLQGKKKFKY